MVFAENSKSRTRMVGSWIIASLLVVAELFVIALFYNEGFEFKCRDALPEAYCAFAGRILPRTLGLLAVLSVALVARKALFRPLLSEGSPHVKTGLWLNLIGFGLILIPLFYISDASGALAVTLAALAWAGGGFMAGLGVALLIAPSRGWRRLLVTAWPTLALLTVAGLLVPELLWFLFRLAYPIWHTGNVIELTFSAVVWMVKALGYAVESDPSIQLIAANDFAVRVGPQCSGVEGFVLITVFLTIYILLFHKDLKFPNALLLYPIGIGISWIFNVARIVVLLAIGADISPELAIGGFHSHAGWLTFTVLSVMLIVLSRLIPFFLKSERRGLRSRSSVFADPIAAKIIPFIVFMVSAILLSTFSQTPSQYYPFRVIALAAAILAFWKIYAKLTWRPGVEPWLAGFAVGLLWVLIPAPAEGAQPYGALTGSALIVWLVMRGVGTIVLVPLTEELFFRDYLESRLRIRSGPVWAILAALISAIAFAALHDRWAEAFVAALCFSLVYNRSGRITDAILAHMVANALVFAVALGTGNMNIL